MCIEGKSLYGVYCIFPPISVVPDNSYPVALAGGNHASEGTVLIQYDGQWGTICDDHWTLTEASVVCQQLGFPGAQSAVSGGRYVHEMYLLTCICIYIHNVSCKNLMYKRSFLMVHRHAYPVMHCCVSLCTCSYIHCKGLVLDMVLSGLMELHVRGMSSSFRTASTILLDQATALTVTMQESYVNVRTYMYLHILVYFMYTYLFNTSPHDLICKYSY